MPKNGYLPDEQSFSSGLPEGKSIYAPHSAQGRTRRERAKQAARKVRVYDRSCADRDKKTK